MTLAPTNQRFDFPPWAMGLIFFILFALLSYAIYISLSNNRISMGNGKFTQEFSRKENPIEFWSCIILFFALALVFGFLTALFIAIHFVVA